MQPPPARSPLEAVWLSTWMAKVSGAVPPEVADEQLLSIALSELEQLVIVNSEYERVFVDIVNKCLRRFFSEQMPPFEPRSSDYMAELTAYMRDVPYVSEKVRRMLGGRPVTTDQSESIRRRLAAHILLMACEALFKQVGLLTTVVDT